MPGAIMPFEPRRPYARLALLGTETATGLPYFEINLALAEEHGGGDVGIWGGTSMSEALAEVRDLKAEGTSVLIDRSARH